MNIYVCTMMLFVHTMVYCTEVWQVEKIPSDLKQTLDAHRTELQKFSQEVTNNFKKLWFFNERKLFGLGLVEGKGVKKFDWLPGYYVKYHVNRVSNAHILKTAMREDNLDKLGVPDKYLYQLYPGKSSITDENYLVIAKEIKSDNKNPFLDLEHVRQLHRLSKRTGFNDLNEANLAISQDGKCYIIDTGGKFGHPFFYALMDNQQQLFYNQNLELLALNRLSGHPLTREARDYVSAEIRKYKSSVPRIKQAIAVGILGGGMYWLYKKLRGN